MKHKPSIQNKPCPSAIPAQPCLLTLPDILLGLALGVESGNELLATRQVDFGLPRDLVVAKVLPLDQIQVSAIFAVNLGSKNALDLPLLGAAGSGSTTFAALITAATLATSATFATTSAPLLSRSNLKTVSWQVRVALVHLKR